MCATQLSLFPNTVETNKKQTFHEKDVKVKSQFVNFLKYSCDNIVFIDKKPRFIPLKKRHYNDFYFGIKTIEYRKYGSRWNETNCEVNRKVILSKGYGKQHRSLGYIVKFEKVNGLFLIDQKAADDVFDIYGTLDIDLALLHIVILYHINKHSVESAIKKA